MQVIRANDADTGPRGAVTYSLQEVRVLPGSSLTPVQVLGYLELEANGDIYYGNVAPEGLSFVVVIKASDGGDPVMDSTTTLRVNVVGTGLTAPIFRYTSRVVSIIESAPGGAFVLEVIVSFSTSLMSHVTRKPDFRVLVQVRLKQAFSATEAS